MTTWYDLPAEIRKAILKSTLPDECELLFTKQVEVDIGDDLKAYTLAPEERLEIPKGLSAAHFRPLSHKLRWQDPSVSGVLTIDKASAELFKELVASRTTIVVEETVLHAVSKKKIYLGRQELSYIPTVKLSLLPTWLTSRVKTVIIGKSLTTQQGLRHNIVDVSALSLLESVIGRYATCCLTATLELRRLFEPPFALATKDRELARKFDEYVGEHGIRFSATDWNDNHETCESFKTIFLHVVTKALEKVEGEQAASSVPTLMAGGAMLMRYL